MYEDDPDVKRLASSDIELLQQLINHGGTQAFSLVPLALAKVITEKQWVNRHDKNGKPFTSFEAFVTDNGLEGLATTIDDLRAFCRKTPKIERLLLETIEPGRTDGGDRRSESFQRDNVTLKRGNTVLYTLKRLKRDQPELFELVIGGAISANEAAKRAGWRKTPSELEQLRAHWQKASEEERQSFLQEMNLMRDEKSSSQEA